MSLFQTKELWSNQCSETGEEYDQNSIIVSRLNGNRDGVLLGSHRGVFRIYQPTIFIPGDANNFRANDLLIEKILDAPILQISTGKYVSGSQQSQIAILHPRSLTIYSLIIKEGNTEHGIQYILNFQYEHKLRRTSLNLTSGPFGRTQNRDFICVQSLDGLLSFFEQETFAFSCFLPNFLLPGPLVYVKSSDAFVTASSAWRLESYTYKSLSEIGYKMTEDEEGFGRKVESNWGYNLGEGVLDVQSVHDDITRQSFIGVLGEKNLYCFNDGGKLRFMKKLEFMPVAFHFYFLNDGKPMFLVISDNNTMLVYQQTTVKWSAKLQFLPIGVSRINYIHIFGCLVFLSELGFLQISYLGTDPNIFSAPPLRNQELDFEAAEKELECLQKSIRGNTPIAISIDTENDLAVTIDVSPHLKQFSEESQKVCQVTIELVPKVMFDEVHVSAFIQKPLVVSPRAHFYTNMSNSAIAICYVHLERITSIPSLNLDVSVSCIKNSGLAKIQRQTVTLPLNLIMETDAPVKENECKVTLNINENPVPLSELFPEYIGENSFTMTSNAIGFKINNSESPIITILTAKTSQRYRIQCDDFSYMNIIVQEVIRRLEKYYSNKENFVISFSSSLPTHEVLKYIEKHFRSSQMVNNLKGELNQLSNQFRLIQKRLVVKFKQKNPTTLSNLDILLQDTFEDVMRVIINLDEEKDKLFEFQIKLSSAMQLVNTLIKLRNDTNGMDEIESVLSPFIYDIENQNWEDVIDAGLCYLLRTKLSKSEKDKNRAPHTSFEEMKDVSKLQKHFVQVLERSTKMEKEKEQVETKTETQGEVEETKTQEVGEFGTEIAKSSSRILSARKSLLRRRHKVSE